MNKLRKQVVLAFDVFLIVVVGGAILCYLFFAEEYYVARKEQVMNEAFRTIWEFNLTDIRPENEEMIMALEEESFSVLICNGQFETIYASKVQQDTAMIENQIKARVELYTTDAEASYQEDLAGKPITLHGLITQDGEDFYVYILENTRVMRRAINYTNRFLEDILLLMLVLGSVFSYVLAGWIVKPVLDIQKAANKISQNDFSVRLPERQPKNEVGELARDINQMAENIQRNVNDLNNYNYLLLHQNQDMAEFEEMRKRLVSSITHQLKTPLAIISNQVELLQYEYDVSKKEYYFSSIMEEIDKMSALISTILQNSKMEHVIQNAELVRENLSELLTNLIPKYETWFSARKIRLVSKIEGDCYARVDRLLVEQAVNNYMTNARRYTQPGGMVRLTLQSQKEGYYLSVYNEGNGLSAEELKKIWIGFYQTEKEKKEGKGRTEIGLGLYIVKDIMRQHGGSCGVLNREGGVEFWLQFQREELKKN